MKLSGEHFLTFVDTIETVASSARPNAVNQFQCPICGGPGKVVIINGTQTMIANCFTCDVMAIYHF